MHLNNQTKSISHITQRNSEPGAIFPKGTNLILGSLLFLATKGAALQERSLSPVLPLCALLGLACVSQKPLEAFFVSCFVCFLLYNRPYPCLLFFALPSF